MIKIGEDSSHEYWEDEFGNTYNIRKILMGRVEEFKGFPSLNKKVSMVDNYNINDKFKPFKRIRKKTIKFKKKPVKKTSYCFDSKLVRWLK